MQIVSIKSCGSYIGEKNKNENQYYHINKYFPDFPDNCLYAESSIQADNNEAHNNYTGLKKLYLKWDRGILKNQRYYKKFVTKYLANITGKDILTEYDYFDFLPESINEKELKCSLLLGEWLLIKGNIKQGNLLKIVEKKPSLLKKWCKYKRLLSVRGRIQDSKIESKEQSKIVILYLTDIIVEESENR